MYTQKYRFNLNQTIASTTTFAESIRNLFADKAALFEGTEAADYFDEIAKKRTALISATDKGTIVSTLDSADKNRDVSIRNIFTGLDAYLIFPNEETLAAAAEVAKAVSKFSRAMTSKNYATESAEAAGFFQALDGVTAEVKKLPYMSELIEKAKADEEAFKRINKEYTQSLAASSSDKNATALKRELISYLNDTLFPYLQALNIMNKGKYDSFLKEIDVELKRATQQQQKQPKADSQQPSKTDSQQPSKTDSQQTESEDFSN